MRIGMKVRLVGKDGEQHQATVTEISGTGKSGFKVLNLAYGDLAIDGIAHSGDQEPGEGFWLLHGEKRPNEDEEVSTTKPAAGRKAGKK